MKHKFNPIFFVVVSIFLISFYLILPRIGIKDDLPVFSMIFWCLAGLSYPIIYSLLFQKRPSFIKALFLVIVFLSCPQLLAFAAYLAEQFASLNHFDYESLQYMKLFFLLFFASGGIGYSIGYAFSLFTAPRAQRV